MVPERAAFRRDEWIDPRWVSFLISKPPLADRGMPLWVRRLQPLFCGVFTVDNLDYVRRDAYMTGVADGARRRRPSAPLHLRVDRGPGPLRVGPRGARDVPHRAPVHVPDGLLPPHGAGHRPRPGGGLLAGHPGHLRRTDPLQALDAYVALDEYALLHQAARWARGHEARPSARRPGMVESRRPSGALWRGILLRQPRWRAVSEVRRDSRRGGRAEVEAILRGSGYDRATGWTWPRPTPSPEYARKLEGRLLVARRDGSLDAGAMGELLDRLPAVVVVGRAYRRIAARSRATA